MGCISWLLGGLGCYSFVRARGVTVWVGLLCDCGFGCFWCCFWFVGFLGVCDLRVGGRGIHWCREFVVGCDAR